MLSFGGLLLAPSFVVGAASATLDHPAWIFAILMAVALVAPIAAERLRVPGIIGVIVAGVIVGPFGTGLLERQGLIASLGTIGLLYLMFVAGLELDLDEFTARRRQAVIFGAITFVIPMVIGIAAFYPMGYDTNATILLASAFASHTLLSYPIFRRYGTVQNRAVSTTVGATIVCDTAALLVLVIVARAHEGTIGAGFWATLVPSLIGLIAVVLWGLPRLAQWFFAGLGQDRSVRFLFVMVALFVSAGLAELAGIEAIIGAFLAGLALNRHVPNSSRLMERIEFLGSSFLIPLFLISVGMLVDPRVLVAGRTLGIAAVFIAVALGAKWLSAEIAGRLFQFDRPEIGAMFSLSSAQAAATLAAVIVALEIGMITDDTMNAVIGVILVTCLVSSWVGERCAPRMSQPPTKQPLGSAVVVPVTHPDSAAPLAQIASSIARRDAGLVVPLTVVGATASVKRVDAAHAIVRDAERMALAEGVEVEGIVRVDASPETGVVHTVVERRASLVVVGWKGHSDRRESLFGSTLDTLTDRVNAPMLVVRPGPSWSGIVVAVFDDVLDALGRTSVRLAVESAKRLATRDQPVRVLATSVPPWLEELAAAELDTQVETALHGRSEGLSGTTVASELLVVPLRSERAGLRGAADRIARDVPNNGLVFALAHGARLRAGTPIMPASTSLQRPMDLDET